MVAELAKLYPETREPSSPIKPVRLPPSVAPLHSTSTARRRQHG
jgi:hypothetical protein